MLRHVSNEAGDSRLVGELIERFGVLQLWLREGATRLISAGRLLTPETLAERPRLALLQCLVLRLSSTFDEATALFDAVARKTDGFTRDRDGDDAEALAMDRVFTGLFAGGGRDPTILQERGRRRGSSRYRTPVRQLEALDRGLTRRDIEQLFGVLAGAGGAADADRSGRSSPGTRGVLRRTDLQRQLRKYRTPRTRPPPTAADLATWTTVYVKICPLRVQTWK